VYEVRERTAADESEIEPVNEEDVVDAASALRDAGVEIGVIAFLHSYRNPTHEQQARAIIEREVPDLRVELSCEVWPQAREYERATLTVINAYVRPTVEAYLDQLMAGLSKRNIESPARVARSNGGMELAMTMGRRPVVTLLSGPAAGVTGAATAARDAGWESADLMTLDVGGTSADIGVVRGGQPVLSTEEHVSDFPVMIPTIAVSSIGAGGGSVIWLDPTGALKVGPRSVGADPGPACYALNGSLTPALTDAFLVSGLLAAGQRLGGKLTLHLEPARQALSGIADQLGWDIEEVADGAIRVAIAMMAAESSNVLARRGVDVPHFRMVAFGGAGPLVAALLAEEIYINAVLIPPTPGALSALGAARADLEGDLVQPVYRLLRDLSAADLARELTVLLQQAAAWIAEQTASLAVTNTTIEVAADLRYDGQGYDVTVLLDPEWLRHGEHVRIAAAFHEAHRATYGHANEAAQIWVKELRAHIVGLVAKPDVLTPAAGRATQPVGQRRIRLAGHLVDAGVYERSQLRLGQVLQGPAIVNQMDTTTLVPPGWQAEVVRSGALVLERQQGGGSVGT
jgi:N-methylhydantoinase A